MWFVVFSSLGYIMLVTHKLFFLGKAILAIFQKQMSQFQQQRYFVFLYRVYFSFQWDCGYHWVYLCRQTPWWNSFALCPSEMLPIYLSCAHLEWQSQTCARGEETAFALNSLHTVHLHNSSCPTDQGYLLKHIFLLPTALLLLAKSASPLKGLLLDFVYYFKPNGYRQKSWNPDQDSSV